jgi:replicative DNA helicase
MATSKEEITQIARLEEKASAYDGKDKIVHFSDYLESQKDGRPIKKFFSQMPQFDYFTDGFETGELVVISGHTGNGKTLLAETISKHFMDQGIKVAWFSYEVPTPKLLEKYSQQIELGLYVPMQLESGNFDWIKFKALEAKTKFDCRMIVIDHLHFLVEMNPRNNMSLNIGAVMRQLKQSIAVNMNLVVLLISHQGQPDSEKEPGIEGIRDSSFIAQESDLVFIVYRQVDSNWDSKSGMEKTYEEGRAVIKVEKARRAGTFRKRIDFIKDGHWLREW